MTYLMALSSGLFAQDSENLLNGHKQEFYPNGKLMREYDFSNGKHEGVYKMYSKDGSLLLEQYFRDGEPDGFFRTYYKNGRLRSESYMKIDHFEGPYKEYFENGLLKKESNCAGGVLNATGIIREYNENGVLISETTLSKGLPVSVKTYYANGRPKGEQSEGKIISYSYDGDGKLHVSINGVEQK